METKSSKNSLIIFLRAHLVFILIILALLLFLYYSYSSRGIFFHLVNGDIAEIESVISSFGWLSSIIFLLLVILEVIIAPMPPFILYISGGFIFGAFLGGVIAILGNIIGALIAFKIGRRYGRKIIERIIRPEAREIFDKVSHKYGAFSIFLLRINPFTSSDLFSYLASITKISTGKFILATVLGLTPSIFLQTYFGGDVITQSSFLSKIFLWLVAFYLVIFIYFIWYLAEGKSGINGAKSEKNKAERLNNKDKQ